MGGKTDVWQGTLALMVLKTLQMIGPQHGYGLARRIERGRLVVALTGMGFKVPAVRAFVDGLGDRVGREPIETLLKEGLATLAA